MGKSLSAARIVLCLASIGCDDAAGGATDDSFGERSCEVEGGTGLLNASGVCESGGLNLDVEILGTPPGTFEYEIFCPGVVRIEQSVETRGQSIWSTDEPIQLPPGPCDIEVSSDDHDTEICFSSSATIEISTTLNRFISLIVDCG